MTTTYVCDKEPIPLFAQGDNTETPSAYLCGTCKRPHQWHANAVYCHGKRLCEDCGVVCQANYYVVCEPCQRKREAAAEARKVANAKRISWREYIALDGSDGWMWIDGAGSNNGYGDHEFMLDHFATELFDGLDPEDLPTYAWACQRISLSVDARDIIENATSDMHEDAAEDLDEEALQEAVDAWCKAQKCVSYTTDDDLVVDLTGFFDEVIAEHKAGGGS